MNGKRSQKDKKKNLLRSKKYRQIDEKHNRSSPEGTWNKEEYS